MALVNDKHKFIFFHLYKCGGTSVRELLGTIDGTQGIIGGHALPMDVKEYYEFRGQKYIDIFNEMFKFTIVRNPFSFLLSVYHYAKSYSSHFWHKDVINMEFKDFPKYYMRKVRYFARTRTYGRSEVVTPYNFIIGKDGQVIPNFIGKLENIDNDMRIILNKIGLPHIELPKSNVNKDNNKHYRDVYDAKTRAYVEKHFAKDLDFFEYEF